MHPACLDDARLLQECSVTRGRRSGPGGQHRNKVETAIRMEHRPTGIKAEASERRSQSENQRRALFRLRVNLALEVRLSAAEGTGPTELWRTRCRNRRLAVNADHADFPALLAEALDRIHATGGDVVPAAVALECSTSQLLKFVKLEPAAWRLVNEWRVARGLHGLA